MTKAELIEMMSEYPDDTVVVVRGWDGGQAPVDVEWVKLKLTPWVDDPYEIDEDGDTDAIYLH